MLIGIQRDVLDPNKLLSPADILADDRRLERLSDEIRKGRMVIPAVEALHIGPISVQTFSRFLLTARDEGGTIRTYEPGDGPDALAAFHAMSATWDAERERLAAERHKRKEYTLEELVETAAEQMARQSEGMDL